MMNQFSVWAPVYPGEPRRLMLHSAEHGWDYFYGFYRRVAVLP